MTDFINFEINKKSLLTKALNCLNDFSSSMYYERTQKLIADIENYILDMSMEFMFDVLCEKMNMLNVLKSVGLTIVDNSQTLEEKLLSYMDIVRELEGDKLFVMVNSRCYIPSNKFRDMVNTALDREYKMLFIDSVEYPKLDREDRYIIDKDLCEI